MRRRVLFSLQMAIPVALKCASKELAQTGWGMQGVALARDAERIRLNAMRNNGWTFWAVVRGMPLEHGSVEHGLSSSQVAAGLECVRDEWRLGEVAWPPNSV